MKSRQPSYFQTESPLAKKQQPRRWMLAVMLTGVIIFKAYPTLIQTLLKDTYTFLATSWTQVGQVAAVFGKLSPASAPLISTEKPTLTADCTIEPDCNLVQSSVQSSVENTLLSPVYIPHVPLSERIALEFQLTGFHPNVAQFRSSPGNSALPSQVIDAIRQDLSKQLETTPQQLNIVQATSRNWPDTCLGLAKVGEFCGQQIVPGWRVVVSEGDQTWVYRSDATGKLLRLESLQPASQAIPTSVINAVFQSVSLQSGLPDSAFKLIDAEPNIWPDSCLGLAKSHHLCTPTLVPGWQITLSSGWERWVYRTNQAGSRVQLDLAASSTRSGLPLLVYRSSDHRLLSKATQHSIWNAIAQNRIAHNTYNTLLGNSRDR